MAYKLDLINVVAEVSVRQYTDGEQKENNTQKQQFNIRTFHNVATGLQVGEKTLSPVKICGHKITIIQMLSTTALLA